MCTVLFIPNKQKCYFVSLRDESPLRTPAFIPDIITTNKKNYLAPIDSYAGGTWVGVNDHEDVIILLNGGFKKHERQTNYRKSRGLIVTELLSSIKPVDDWKQIDMSNIEPFTLIVWSRSSLYQLVWDGDSKHQINLDSTKAQLWSSSSLYTPEAKVNRNEIFEAWLMRNPVISYHSVFKLLNSYTENDNGFIMNRNEKVKTLSYSFLEIIPEEIVSYTYYDFVTDSINSKTMKLLNV